MTTKLKADDNRTATFETDEQLIAALTPLAKIMHSPDFPDPKNPDSKKFSMPSFYEEIATMEYEGKKVRIGAASMTIPHLYVFIEGRPTVCFPAGKYLASAFMAALAATASYEKLAKKKRRVP